MLFILINRLRGRVEALHGWQRLALAFVLGAFAALALAPVFIFPFILISFTGLYWLLVSSARGRQAAAAGWWWGLGYFLAGTYWICISLLVDAAQFSWLIPFALIGLNGIFALYPMLACWLWYSLRRKGLAGVFILAGIWVLCEMLRGYLFTGFPWNLVGYAMSFNDAAIQPASWVGVYGLSWITMVLAVLPALLAYDDKKTALRANFIAYGLFACLMLWGYSRLEHAHITYHEGIRLRLVQASIPQRMKWDPQQKAEHLRMYIELSRAPGADKITHVIWPETAVPYTINGAGSLSRLLAESLPAGGTLITGIVREEGDETSWRVWNSVIAVDDQGEILSAYDKHALVPFGEFVPLRSFLPINKITSGTKDFSRGPGPQSMALGKLPPFSPLVCYESIFPFSAVNNAARPQWMLNVTNDAWFGNSSGPYQHLEAARMRAVEQGLPLVRVANTGISAVFNSYGEMERNLPLNMRGWMDVWLPTPVQNGTFYSQFGMIIDLLLIVLSTLCAITRK